MAKNKFYAIRKGKEVGVFEEGWNEVNAKYIKGFSGAEFKGFSTREEAEEWFNGGQASIKEEDVSPDTPIIYVDGSYKDEQIGYGLVYTRGGEEVLRDCGRVVLSSSIITDLGNDNSGEDPRNVAGEIYGAIRAIQLGIANGEKEIVIGYDYKGIECWVTKSWTPRSAYSKRYVSYVESLKDRISIKFIYTKAHKGHKFNEIADNLAKLGTTL